MNTSNERAVDTDKVLALLEQHYKDFYGLVEVARKTKHPVPMDTRGWSQIIVSVLTGIPGLGRKKGTDFEDGSDVKAANTWEAIDTPRFNGCIKAGTKATAAGTLKSLDKVPHLFFVLWDEKSTGAHRCRIWCVHPAVDERFRKMCASWYKAAKAGTIKSNNFQLHPPRGEDTDVFSNTKGTLKYPLLLCAERERDENYKLKCFNPKALAEGRCEDADPTGVLERIIADPM